MSNSMIVEIGAVYRLKSSLLVASASGPLRSGLDGATVRDGNEIPYIPSSTIKGRLRWQIERLLRGWGWSESICNPPAPEDMCPHTWAKPDHQICPVCGLFGCPETAGRIRITPALPLDSAEVTECCKPKHSAIPGGVALRRTHGGKEALLPLTGERIHVSISRGRRVAEDDQLFQLDVADPVRVPLFRTTISLRETDETGARRTTAILLAGLLTIDRFGGNRSRGYGEVELFDYSITAGEAVWKREEVFDKGLSYWKKGPEDGA